MNKNLLDYLLEKYNLLLTVKDIDLLIQSLGLNRNSCNWHEETVIGMAELMIGAKQRREQEEYSVFEDNNDYYTKQEPRSTDSILKDIESKCSSSTKFTMICNKLYTLLNGYLAEPNNPLNSFVAIMGEDYDNNSLILCLIDELCTRHELITEIKPKGVLVKANVVAFKGQYESLKSILNKYKDQSVGVGGDSKTRDQKNL